MSDKFKLRVIIVHLVQLLDDKKTEGIYEQNTAAKVF